MAYTLDAMLEKFGVVDVMDVELYKAEKNEDGTWDNTTTFAGGVLADLKSLTITNINCEGPVTEIKGGRGASTLIRAGKTYSFEATDVLGNYNVLTEIYGAEISTNKGILAITDKFAPELTLVGTTQVIDEETKVKQLIKVVIPFLLEASTFNFVQQSEGEAATFDLSGAINDFCETPASLTDTGGKYTSGGDRQYYFIATQEEYATLAGTDYIDKFTV